MFCSKCCKVGGVCVAFKARHINHNKKLGKEIWQLPKKKTKKKTDFLKMFLFKGQMGSGFCLGPPDPIAAAPVQ